jgi:hypothetical protein
MPAIRQNHDPQDATHHHYTNVSQGLTDPEDDQRRQKIFDSECRAYEIAGEDTFLRDHIPYSFRRCVITDVIEDDKSAATNYLLQCCYAMEYLEGVATKLRALDDHLTHISEAKRAFHSAGIRHTTDASVFFATDPTPSYGTQSDTEHLCGNGRRFGTQVRSF